MVLVLAECGVWKNKMKTLFVAFALVLVSGSVLAEAPTRAEQRKDVMEYLCKKDPVLCRERGWMKDFN